MGLQYLKCYLFDNMNNQAIQINDSSSVLENDLHF